MGGTRVALLVGCSQYDDLTFRRLPADRDVRALARVLEDPTIGDFTAEILLNDGYDKIRVRIERFFANRKQDDLLLLYFSCHGVRDSSGQLHFVANDTVNESLSSTGVSAKWVRAQMDDSRSQRIVLLLDCCYSGSFTRSLVHRGPNAQEIFEQLGGHGRMIITASSNTEFAYESKFTDAVVKGLETGAADLDGDGQVSACELYYYVHDQVLQNTRGQTPTMSADGMRGRLYLAKNPHVPLPLPTVIDQVLKSPRNAQRLWAVEGLQHLLTGDHPGGLKLTVRRTLDRLRESDTSFRVRKAAENVLHNVSRRTNDADGRRARYRRVAVFLVSALVLASLVVWSLLPVGEPSACAPKTIAADGVLSLGTLLPKTGQFVYTGPALNAGVQLAMKDINDNGGIPGIFVKLDQVNQVDEGDPSTGTASQSIDALLAGGVDVIIGPATSATALKVIDKVTCAGVIMFSPSNTSPLFSGYPAHGLYFRTASPSNKLEGSALGKLVGKSTAVVMSRDDVYGNPLRDETVKAIQESGGRVLDSFSYDPNARDYDREIQRVKDKNPDAIVLIGFNESARILAGMIKEGLGPRVKRVYGSTGNMTTTLAGQVSPRDPSVLAGMQGILPEAGDEEFVKRLRGNNPGLQDLTYTAQAYDAVMITALAAAVAGTDEPTAIAKEINGVTKGSEKCASFAACMTLVKAHKNIAYVGPSGPLRFTDHGEPSTATYVISEIQADGTIKPLRRITD